MSYDDYKLDTPERFDGPSPAFEQWALAVADELNRLSEQVRGQDFSEQMTDMYAEDFSPEKAARTLIERAIRK